MMMIKSSELTSARPVAFSYVRLSSEAQIAGMGQARQLEAARRYCEQHGLELVEDTISDLGVSGYRGANAREGALAEFLEAVKSGAVPRGSSLLIESLDRLTRQTPRKAIRLIEQIIELGITVITLSDGKQYNEASLDGDPLALMTIIIVAARSHDESLMKSTRGRSNWSQKRSRASDVKLTAKAKWWLQLSPDRKSFTVIPKRAAVVKRIFDMADQEGLGLHGIVQRLTDEHVTPPRGTQWSRIVVRRWLSEPDVIGTFRPHTIEYNARGKRVRVPATPIPDYYPAIIGKEQYERVRRLIEKNTLRGAAAATKGADAARTRKLSNVLSGVGKCPECGGPISYYARGFLDGRKRPDYLRCEKATKKVRGRRLCKNTGLVRVDHVETALMNYSPLAELDHISGTVEHPDMDKLREIESSIAGLNDLADMLISKGRAGLSKAIRQRLDDLNSELADLERERDELQRSVSREVPSTFAYQIADLDEALHSKPFDRHKVNTALRKTVEGVVVTKEALRVTWVTGAVTDVELRFPAVAPEDAAA